ncbi:MAG: caspase family protein [Pirellula sp.]|jgi:hypothetical protein|nr:caspase family protein [Pirellula sp.]
MVELKRWGLALAYLILAVPSALAQNVHAVVIGDMSPSAQWGKYTSKINLDLTTWYVFFHENMPENRLVYQSFGIEEDDSSDPRLVLEMIREMSPSPNDSLVVCYSGHGGADDVGHYFQLAKGKLYRKDVLAAMQARQPRLAVLLSDCCNSRSDGYQMVAAAPRVDEPKTVTPLFQSLMLESKGIVDINSSSPGESSFFTPLKSEGMGLEGSIFTSEIAKWAAAHKNRRVSWYEMVHDVSLQVHTAFKDYYPKGAAVAKGQPSQLQQNVYATTFPGMPDKTGTRAGIVARDFAGRGVVILEVAAKSPATQVYDVKAKRFVSLKPQQVVTSIQGVSVTNVESLLKLIADAPQIMRIGIRDTQSGDHEFLLRKRY